MRFRIAPSPTGFLHLGNLLNFQLNAELSKEFQAQLGVRIDDIDRARFRPQYLTDIFQKLVSLQIQADFGPRSESDFYSTYSQQIRLDEYRNNLNLLSSKTNRIFKCTCSRPQLIERKCVAGCKNLALSGIDHVVRFETASVDEVLWRKENIPSYLLTDLVDDTLNEITHVVRGIDLYEASQIQKELRAELGLPIPTYIFHPLVMTANGKLSKSQGTAELGVSDDLLSWIQTTSEELLPILIEQLTSPIQSAEDLPPINIG
jgi:glutamyl-tRNA synthetase